MALPLPFGGAGRRTPGRGWAQVVAHPRLAIILACVLGWLAWRTFRGIGSTGGVVSQSGVLKLPLSTALFASVVLPPNDAPGARPRVLVTGGAGYIGSHTCVELVGAGYAVTIVDNLGNAQEAVVGRIRALVSAPEAVTFVQGDVRDEALLARVLSAAKHIAVIHFAAFKGACWAWHAACQLSTQCTRLGPCSLPFHPCVSSCGREYRQAARLLPEQRRRTKHDSRCCQGVRVRMGAVAIMC